MKILLSLTLLLPTALIGACGFQPLYGTRAETATVLDHFALIDIATIPGRNGQMLRNMLVERLQEEGSVQNPSYRLVIADLLEDPEELGIRQDATATRIRLDYTAQMHLIDAGSNTKLLSRTLRASAAYNVLDSQFTTRISKTDAQEKALRDLSSQITTQLSLHFKGRP